MMSSQFTRENSAFVRQRRATCIPASRTHTACLFPVNGTPQELALKCISEIVAELVKAVDDKVDVNLTRLKSEVSKK